MSNHRALLNYDDLIGAYRCHVCGDPADLSRCPIIHDDESVRQWKAKHSLDAKRAPGCLVFHEYRGLARLLFRRDTRRIAYLAPQGWPFGAAGEQAERDKPEAVVEEGEGDKGTSDKPPDLSPDADELARRMEEFYDEFLDTNWYDPEYEG